MKIDRIIPNEIVIIFNIPRDIFNFSCLCVKFFNIIIGFEHCQKYGKILNHISCECISYYPHETFLQTVKHGNIDACKWLLKFYNIRKTHLIPSKLSYTYPHLYLFLCEFFYEGNAVRLAIENNNLEMCKWLIKTFQINGNDIDLKDFELTLTLGHLHISKWLTKKFLLKRIDIIYPNFFKTVEQIIKNHYWEVFLWLGHTFDLRRRDIFSHNQDLRWFIDHIVYVPWLWHHSDSRRLILYIIVKYWVTELQKISTKNNGRVIGLEWFFEIFKLSEVFTKKDINAIKMYTLCLLSKQGYLELLKQIIEIFSIQRHEIILPHHKHAFLYAAINGHLEVCKWLHSTFKLKTKNVNRIMLSDITNQETLIWIKETFKL